MIRVAPRRYPGRLRRWVRLRSVRLRSDLTMLVAASIAAGACLRPTRSALTAICTGANVAQRLTLTVDSLTPRASAEFARIRGAHVDLTLNLYNSYTTGNCADRSGTADVTADELPDLLAAGVASRHGGEWYLDGPTVRIALRPGVIGEHLDFTLPLDGSAGRWRLATLAGTEAMGRLVPVRPGS